MGGRRGPLLSLYYVVGKLSPIIWQEARAGERKWVAGLTMPVGFFIATRVAVVP